MSYINLQLVDVVHIIDSIQYELQDLKDEKGILNVTKESDKYFRALTMHESNERNLNLKIKSLESLKTYLTNAKEENILPPSLYVINEDAYLSSSINEFYESQLQKIEMTHGFKKGHQELDKIEEKIINKRKDLLLYIQNRLDS